MKKAQELDINTPIVLDYYLVPGTCNLRRSTGVFLEQRARGEVLNERGIILFPNKEYEFDDVCKDYLERINRYINILEKRSFAEQRVFDKLIDDYIKFNEIGLVPDANSLNFLYDENFGFSIIDPVMQEDSSFSKKNLFKYIMNGIYGGSRPKFIFKYGKGIGNFDLPKEYRNKMKKITEELNAKIVKAFKNKGFSLEYIMNGLNTTAVKYFVTDNDMDSLEFREMLEEWFINLKEELENNKEKGL